MPTWRLECYQVIGRQWLAQRQFPISIAKDKGSYSVYGPGTSLQATSPTRGASRERSSWLLVPKVKGGTLHIDLFRV